MKTKFIIKTKKKRIPRALREQIWIKRNKKKFEVKCPIKWCRNRITCFNFQSQRPKFFVSAAVPSVPDQS